MGRHLTLEQRYQLAALHKIGMTQAAIAARIGVSQSAVCRERLVSVSGYPSMCDNVLYRM